MSDENSGTPVEEGIPTKRGDAGLPKIRPDVVSDSVDSVTSDELDARQRRMGVRRKRSGPERPQADAMTEQDDNVPDVPQTDAAESPEA